MAIKAHSLQHTAPLTIEYRQIDLPPVEHNQVRAKAVCSGISAGTEALVFQGKIESGIQLDASLPELKDNTTAYPFPYGYAWVGQIEELGSEVKGLAVGDRIFAFAPHQDQHVLNAADCLLLPETLSSSKATLLPSLETALAIAHDAAPVAGEKICIFGQGLIGILTTWVLSQFPLSELKAVEPNTQRHQKSIQAGAHEALIPEQLTQNIEADTTIEVSGNPNALSDAIKHTKANGKVVVASWYGTRTAEINLGTHFHRGRIKLLSSQVSTIKPSLEGTWNKSRRLRYALELLSQLPEDLLATDTISFQDCEKHYPAVFEHQAGLTHTYFNYGE